MKLCVWMNIPSHYQTAFYEALALHNEIDLKVCYFNGVSSTRAAEGWNSEHNLKAYEISCEHASTPDAMVNCVDDWMDRIHIISANFSSALVDFLCEKGARWCHWSEMPGVRLADLLGYRMELFRLINPLMLTLKQAEGRRIKAHALGAFGQGCMARRAFAKMGVPYDRTADLFYAPEPLIKSDPGDRILTFSNGRKVFVAVGALCARKGIDILLKAFAALKTSDWCLVFCGLDKENGRYQKLAEKLGIENRVLFLGAWPRDRIAEVYAASDVFVLPSNFDGWGAVLNEAASVGLPLIGTDLCGGSWHAIQPGKNGFRARAGSVSSLKAAMKNYTDHPELVADHGEASQEIFETELTPEKNAERLVLGLKKWVTSEG